MSSLREVYNMVCKSIASARGSSLELEGIDTDTRESIDYEDYWWMDWHGWDVNDFRHEDYRRVSDILRRIKKDK